MTLADSPTRLRPGPRGGSVAEITLQTGGWTIDRDLKGAPASTLGSSGYLESHLLDQAQAALVAFDLSGTVTHWNRFAEVIYGWSQSDAVGRDVRDLMIPPTMRTGFERVLKGVLGGEAWEGDTRHSRADGRNLEIHVTYSPISSDTGEIAGIVGVSFDISERLRAERRTLASQAVTRILSEADHVYGAAPLLLEAVCENLDWDIGALWRVDRLSEELRCVDVWRRRSPLLARFEEVVRWTTFKKGIGLPGAVWETRSTRWIVDVHDESNFTRRDAAIEAGLRSGVGFPILLRGEVLGLLEFFGSEKREPDEDLIEMVTAVGSQIGQFMERKQAEEDRRLSEARTSAVVESAMDAIIAMDHLGKIVDFNPAAEETFGYSREEVIGQEMAGLIIPQDLRDAHRQGLLRYLETNQAVVIGKRIEIVAQRKDGSIFPVELTVQRVDMPGAPMFTGYIRDITDRRESERERLRLLEAEQAARAEAERASKRLSQLQRITDAALSHLAVDELLDELLYRINDILGSDMSAILLVREDGQDLAVRSAIGLSVDLSELNPIPIGSQAAGTVALTGRPLIVNDLEASEHEAPIMRSERMRSMMIVPLLLENRTLGVFVTATQEPDRFSDDDLALLQLAADRIASPIQNASLFEREHRIATQLQRSLLPRVLPNLKDLEVCERYVPGGAGLQVGGDWYDVLELPGGLSGLVIGDVVGKGIRAASVMGQIRNALRAFAFEARDPGDVLTRLNRLTETFDRATMATLLYAVYDPNLRTLTYSSAGHPPPLMKIGGSIEQMDLTENIPLGVMPDEKFHTRSVPLAAGSILLLYTDGLIEEPGNSIDVGIERVKEAFLAAPDDLSDVCDHILGEVFRDRPRSDDVALLAIKTLG